VQVKPHKIITPEPLAFSAYLREVFIFRSLILVFATQEIKKQYAQTYFGILWSFIRPAITLLIFSLIFDQFLNVSTDSPYTLFAFSGLIVWNFFTGIVQQASTAILSRQDIIKKMYFPRLVLPLSKVLVAGVDFAVSLIFFFILCLYYQFSPSINILSLPIFILLTVSCGLCISLWMIALSIRFRDLHQVVPPLIGMAIWITPVFYPSTIIPETFSFFLHANPIAGIIKGFRFALLGEAFPEWPYWISMGVCFLLSIVAAWFLSKKENVIVDYI
jgi:lipopolysaccharide transport system permease protein